MTPRGLQITPCRAAAILGAVALAAPRAAAACPNCISSAFGDRSYTWAYLGLIVMPFVVAVTIVAVLAWYAGWRPAHVRQRISAWTARLRHRPAPAAPSPRTHTETT
jgi:hypothetical protein